MGIEKHIVTYGGVDDLVELQFSIIDVYNHLESRLDNETFVSSVHETLQNI